MSRTYVAYVVVIAAAASTALFICDVLYVYLLAPFEAVLAFDACYAEPVAPVERVAAHLLRGGVLGLSLPLFDGLEVPPIRDRDAETAYQAAYERDPNDPYTLVALVELKLRSLALKSAVTYFEKLFASATEDTHPARLRGQALVREYHAKLGGR